MTVKVIFDEVQFQTRKSSSRSGGYKFLGLKLFDFRLLNPFETLSDVNSSPKPLASQKFASFYDNRDQYIELNFDRYFGHVSKSGKLFLYKLICSINYNCSIEWYGSSNLETLDQPDFNRSVLVSIIVKTRKLLTSERFGTWIHITQSFKRIQ